MKKRFYLVRHGDKEKTPGDPPLSVLGKKQAKAVANYLKSYSIQKIVTSPILRAKQTAEEIASNFNLKIEVSNLLKERANWGDDPTQSYEDFVIMWERAIVDRDWTPPVGDSSRTAGKRLQQLIENIDEVNSQIVLVTHGGIITDFLLNVFDEKKLNSAFQGFTDSKIANIHECSVTIIDYDQNSRFELVTLADNRHLQS